VLINYCSKVITALSQRATTTNVTKPTTRNATSTNAMMGHRSYNSQSHSIASACQSSQRFNDCGKSEANAHSVAVRVAVVHGFLVYKALVVDSSNNFQGVLVDPGNGKVTVSTPMSCNDA
jgi:hypothetical protein